MKKNILFVNASYIGNIKKILAAKELGLRISIVGTELPQWVSPYVDTFIEADTKNFSQTLSILRKAYSQEKFHGVLTLWDRDVELTALIAEEFKLPGSSFLAAHTAKHKLKTREVLRDQGVPHPHFKPVNSLEDLYGAVEEIGLPLIFKPVGASSSAAIFKLETKDRVKDYFDLMLNCKRTPYWLYPSEYIAEEFMEGQEVSVEGIVNHSEVQIIGVTQKWTTAESFTEWQHCFPANLKPAVATEVINIAKRAVKAVGIDFCAFHAEVIITKEGPKIVEINARMGGDCIASHLVPLSSGINMAQMSILTALGEPVKINPNIEKFVCIRYLLANQNGILRSWVNADNLSEKPGIVVTSILKNLGDMVSVPPLGFNENRLCYVISAASQFKDAINLCESALENVGYHVSSE